MLRACINEGYSMKNNDILLVSDTKYELDSVQRLLVEDYGHILQTIDELEGNELFAKYYPSLIILAHSDVEKAEKFYISLYKSNTKISSTPHKTLLLCKGKESEKAYELCINGIMDDFVADRPMFDPFRLRFAVKQAFELLEQEQESFLHSQKVESISKDLRHLNQFVVSKLDVAGGLQGNAITNFTYFTDKLTAEINELESSLSPLFLSSGSDDDKCEIVGKQLKDLYEKTLKEGSEQVLKELNKTGKNMDSLAKDVKSRIDQIEDKKKNTKRIHVLIVDDDEMYCEMLAEMIQSNSVRIHSLHSGKEAIEYLQSEKPDLILLDYMMPEMNGIEVLRDIKNNPAIKEIPIIMLTGDSSLKVVIESKKAGAIEYIIKPSDRRTILLKIKNVTGLGQKENKLSLTQSLDYER